MIVISLLFDHAPGALANHRRYARTHGYRHVEIDMRELSGSNPNVQWMYKYETLLHWLDRLQPGEMAMMLSENVAILGSLSLPQLLEDRDWLLACVESNRPQTDMQVWRNTEDVRRRLHEVVSRCRFDVKLPAEEALLLRDFEMLAWPHQIRDTYVVVPAAAALESVWTTWRAFAVCIRDEKHHRRFRAALFAHVNERTARNLPLSPISNAPALDTSARVVYHPGHAIAVVTLYTPNIACYGRLAEANFRRYCERHGYTLYVHREIPAHLNDGNIAGNWLKPALLRECMANHEWVFWIDADVLINDMNRKLESIMHAGDTVFARDVGTWAFNSGIMGFRRTQANYDGLNRILDACAQLDDRSSVYANKGDQYYFTREFGERAEYDPTRVASLVDWNTAWIYRRPDSFTVHYIGIWNEHKALLMDYDLARSARE
ncbi:hypothetical protein [Caballeronia sp. Lep1P3]|uniref:hypothetical protein n=1 Tax=Caballeronia sp. Lep1P3 TaxID=2878150 RepID=UPI001FD32506|nr:hypothetical protein [Caballeronia sp. Lep1P3]